MFLSLKSVVLIIKMCFCGMIFSLSRLRLRVKEGLWRLIRILRWLGLSLMWLVVIGLLMKMFFCVLKCLSCSLMWCLLKIVVSWCREYDLLSVIWLKLSGICFWLYVVRFRLSLIRFNGDCLYLKCVFCM